VDPDHVAVRGALLTTLRVENVPPETVGVLAAELRKYGCDVGFRSLFSGQVTHAAGTVEFEHDGIHTLTCEVVTDGGHFPGLLLIGGMRQLIEEAAEDVRNR
jgi:hypothetical protein